MVELVRDPLGEVAVDEALDEVQGGGDARAERAARDDRAGVDPADAPGGALGAEPVGEQVDVLPVGGPRPAVEEADLGEEERPGADARHGGAVAPADGGDGLEHRTVAERAVEVDGTGHDQQVGPLEHVGRRARVEAEPAEGRDGSPVHRDGVDLEGRLGAPPLGEAVRRDEHLQGAAGVEQVDVVEEQDRHVHGAIVAGRAASGVRSDLPPDGGSAGLRGSPRRAGFVIVIGEPGHVAQFGRWEQRTTAATRRPSRPAVG